MRNTLQIWASLFPLFHSFFAPGLIWERFSLRCRLWRRTAKNRSLLWICEYAIFPEKFTHPCPLWHLLYDLFYSGAEYSKGRHGEKRRPPASQKNVRISHLVVFMLLTPCGPWRCWKHGKRRRDQSALISISSELEWSGCMVRPTPLLGPRQQPVVLPSPHCAFVSFQQQENVGASGCFPRAKVARRIMGKKTITYLSSCTLTAD